MAYTSSCCRLSIDIPYHLDVIKKRERVKKRVKNHFSLSHITNNQAET